MRTSLPLQLRYKREAFKAENASSWHDLFFLQPGAHPVLRDFQPCPDNKNGPACIVFGLQAGLHRFSASALLFLHHLDGQSLAGELLHGAVNGIVVLGRDT